MTRKSNTNEFDGGSVQNLRKTSTGYLCTIVIKVHAWTKSTQTVEDHTETIEIPGKPRL